MLPKRPPDANKGTFGRVLVCGGSANYIGAIYLACEAALRVGAGLVTLATPGEPAAHSGLQADGGHLRAVARVGAGRSGGRRAEAIRSSLADGDVLLLGCGLGQSASALSLGGAIIAGSPPLPLVLDADALNLLAKDPQWWRNLPGDAVLTPHPGEMSRLTGLSVEEVQSRRVSAAVEPARAWQKTVVLKGAYTVVAGPDGRVGINPVANPGLASAGTGDVLAGAIAGLSAQGCSPFDAAVAGVFLHGQAGSW